MRILEAGEIDYTIILTEEIEGRKDIIDWVFWPHRYKIIEYIEEAKKCFPDGLTYQECFEYLGGK